MQKNCWRKGISQCPSQFTSLFWYLPTHGVGIIASCRIAVRVQRRPESCAPRQVFAGSLIKISMAARTGDLAIGYPAISVYGQPETRRAFPFFAQGPRRIVVCIGPASGIAARLRIRPLWRRWRRRRRWWWCNHWPWWWWRCWHGPDYRPWCSHRCNDRRRRDHGWWLDRLVGRRWRWLLRFFWRFFFINVDHVQLRRNLLHRGIGQSRDQRIAK